MGYVQILSSPMQNAQGKWVIGYHAGRICGDGRFGYVVYGELTRAAVVKKIINMGYKTLNRR